MKLGLAHAAAGMDVPQTFHVGKPGEGHAEELIPRREALDLVVAVVAIDTLAELAPRYEPSVGRRSSGQRQWAIPSYENERVWPAAVHLFKSMKPRMCRIHSTIS